MERTDGYCNIRLIRDKSYTMTIVVVKVQCTQCSAHKSYIPRRDVQILHFSLCVCVCVCVLEKVRESIHGSVCPFVCMSWLSGYLSISLSLPMSLFACVLSAYLSISPSASLSIYHTLKGYPPTRRQKVIHDAHCLRWMSRGESTSMLASG